MASSRAGTIRCKGNGMNSNDFLARGLGLLCCLAVLGGCTSVRVEPLKSAADSMCIESNPRVMVTDFLPVLQAGFARHGITTQVHDKVPTQGCDYLLRYTAKRSWDVTPYLSFAELSVLGPQRQTLASAHYHLRGKGGLSLMKWQGTQAKMDPVIDQLLGNLSLLPSAAAMSQPASAASTASLSTDAQIKALQEEKLDYQEYQRRYRLIMLESSQ